ncbi:hypothetical protein HW48_004598 [Salmonella enterica subsp. enterica]|nr:hypothetical protein [Salmonella enterica subsp. enterica]EJM7831457.1 hypothetical protein [Salmonella enterica]EJT0199990.1 hypothetical protein [Salmonella enterica]
MATLKDHQQAMVDLLASGSGIPASASRLAHAMHDVLNLLVQTGIGGAKDLDIEYAFKQLVEATTPGLNDKALAGDIEACRPKATPAERRVKELENTVKQLRASNAKLRIERDDLKGMLGCGPAYYREPEQAGRRKDDTQECEHNWRIVQYPFSNETYNKCDKCGSIEQ